ncbi:DNA damage-regulated autophagy modulator protein [Dermatophagoides pteronyssinus]|uniref:DNA damage-regulated autophagy modulator protein n=1 Tax=Dermatophagoides pteronyssinus TaxID=6956 RepID=A0ABQ8JRJ3_DERPT|nr:DNA damage-regulated autophagy modulator protein [Dermatophagoides pteronyssinus]
MATTAENSISIDQNIDPESNHNNHNNNNNNRQQQQHLNTNSDREWKKHFYSRIKNNLWLFGFLGSFFTTFICIMPYALTYQNGHYHPIFPYVSDSASFPPVASYFSQSLDMIAIIFAITVWARYKQIKYYLNNNSFTDSLNKNNDQSSSSSYNLQLLYLFIGNFRTVENMTGHLIGVTLIFSFIPIILLIQIYLIEQLYRYNQIETRAISLIIITIINIISTFISSLTALIAVLYHGTPFKYWDNNFRLYWSSEMDGYHWHLTSTVAEWIAIVSFAPILFSISKRIRSFKHWDQIQF